MAQGTACSSWPWVEALGGGSRQSETQPPLGFPREGQQAHSRAFHTLSECMSPVDVGSSRAHVPGFQVHVPAASYVLCQIQVWGPFSPYCFQKKEAKLSMPSSCCQ